MHDLTIGVFENLDITSPMDVDKRLAYKQLILRGATLKKYQKVLVKWKQLAKELAGDYWTLGELDRLSAENFWTWANTDTIGYYGHDYLARDKWFDFERELWFESGKCMWRKHRSVYQDHMNYICNDIAKAFKVKILRYSKRGRNMHDLSKYLPPPSTKGKSAEADYFDCPQPGVHGQWRPICHQGRTPIIHAGWVGGPSRGLSLLDLWRLVWPPVHNWG